MNYIFIIITVIIIIITIIIKIRIIFFIKRQNRNIPPDVTQIHELYKFVVPNSSVVFELTREE